MPESSLRVGLVFEGFGAYPRRPGDPEDFAVEFEPESTLLALEAAIRRLGHRPERIGTPRDLLAALAGGEPASIDVAFNIAEGQGSRNREAWAPVLLEMAGVPCLGSDALTLSLSLDKAWTNRFVAAADVPTAPQTSIGAEEAIDPARLPAPFPLFVKPRWEGTSKGIRASSRVEDLEALEREVARIHADYRQPALVEAFLSGAEYTVTIVGNDPPRALPVLQRALEAETRIGLHAIEGVHEELRDAGPSALESCLPGDLAPDLEARLERLALRVYERFDCLDFARVDFRLDRDGGQPVFLELNPLPTFAIDGSFGILAELQGREVEDLLADVIRTGLERLGLTAANPSSP